MILAAFQKKEWQYSIVLICEAWLAGSVVVREAGQQPAFLRVVGRLALEER